MELLLAAYAFLFGAVIGSFLNVVIYRVPREESIVFPPSRCPHCGARIKIWQNIPILSYVLLRGRCGNCRGVISPRYPLIELANGLFYLALYLHLGVSWALPLTAAIVSMLIALIFIDLDIQILPNAIDIPGIFVGLALGALHAGMIPTELTLTRNLVDSLIGAALGFLILFTIAYVYRVIRGGEGMGQGDMKMMAMLGAVFGWQPILPLLFLASATGAVAGITLALGARERLKQALPFGLFLGLAAIIVLFFGSTLIGWYVSLLAPVP
jgi:leader peptidase (prepilin peptidase)/N-methyltransferase